MLMATDDLSYERRVDGLVAVHVLGWHQVFLDLGNVWADSAGGTRRRVISWAPTSDGNNMLAVIKAMQRRQYKLLLEWLPSRGTYCGPGDRAVPLWSCAFYVGSLGEYPARGIGRGDADTAPMAVAVAALKALGIEVPADDR